MIKTSSLWSSSFLAAQYPNYVQLLHTDPNLSGLIFSVHLIVSPNWAAVISDYKIALHSSFHSILVNPSAINHHQHCLHVKCTAHFFGWLTLWYSTTFRNSTVCSITIPPIRLSFRQGPFPPFLAACPPAMETIHFFLVVLRVSVLAPFKTSHLQP